MKKKTKKQPRHRHRCERVKAKYLKVGKGKEKCSCHGTVVPSFLPVRVENSCEEYLFFCLGSLHIYVIQLLYYVFSMFLHCTFHFTVCHASFHCCCEIVVIMAPFSFSFSFFALFFFYIRNHVHRIDSLQGDSAVWPSPRRSYSLERTGHIVFEHLWELGRLVVLVVSRVASTMSTLCRIQFHLPTRRRLQLAFAKWLSFLLCNSPSEWGYTTRSLSHGQGKGI